jgi:hypothetical protein
LTRKQPLCGKKWIAKCRLSNCHLDVSIDINKFFRVLVFHADEVGPKRFRATAYVFRRDCLDTPDNRVGEFVGVGSTMNSADYDAYRQAKRFAKLQRNPLDWAGR